MIRFVCVAACLLLLCGCGGATVFTPTSGIFEGALMVDGEQLGSFNYTVTGNLIGGTGTLVYLGGPIPVAVSGAISGRSITGGLANNLGGSGPFVGSFGTKSTAAGTFRFTDLDGAQPLEGTWTAIAVQQ
jgi:hypothetical protein